MSYNFYLKVKLLTFFSTLEILFYSFSKDMEHSMFSWSILLELTLLIAFMSLVRLGHTQLEGVINFNSQLQSLSSLNQ